MYIFILNEIYTHVTVKETYKSDLTKIRFP